MKILSALMLTLFLMQGCGSDNTTSSDPVKRTQNVAETQDNPDTHGRLYIDTLSRENLNAMGMSFERKPGTRTHQVILSLRSCIRPTVNREYEKNLRLIKNGLEEKYGVSLYNMQYKTIYISGSGRIRADLMYKYVIDALERLIYRDPNSLCGYYSATVLY